MVKLDQIVLFFFQLLLEINKVYIIYGIQFFQFITVRVDVLDQYSIVDCDSVFEKRNFH